MTVHAKEIINGKFWILEDDGEKIATLSLTDNKFLLADKKGTHFFDNTKFIENNFGKNIIWDKLNITEHIPFEVYGYETSVIPFNPVFDVKRKLPLFTKSQNSKSLYCAGFYIIEFEKGWVKSFCPKLITIEKYNYEGPFHTKIEMKNKLGTKCKLKKSTHTV
tara:strand:+ start:125 stop:613 length:489 start_codon:yes stop_codon:yes gene_type:complete